MKHGVFLEGGKWASYFNGKIIGSPVGSKYYAEKKFKDMSSANPTEVGDETDSVHFSVDQRFKFCTELVTMVANKQTPSTIIAGGGGLGKSFTVMEALHAAGLRPRQVDASRDWSGRSYTLIKGYSTSRGLYNTLKDNSDKIVVLDDCDSIHKDDNAVNVLKGALDSYDERIVTWNSNMAESFRFQGGVIFVTNLPMERIDQALRSRSMCVDLEMTVEEKVKRMETIAQSPKFMPEIDVEFKARALDLISTNKTRARDLNLRSLVAVTKIAANGSRDWEELALYTLMNG